MIIQGSNLPIILRFYDGTPTNLTQIEVSLGSCGKEFKHWSKDDMEFHGADIYCPLTQEETMAMQPGVCTIEVKWLIDNQTWFAEAVKDKVIHRHDRSIMSLEGGIA